MFDFAQQHTTSFFSVQMAAYNYSGPTHLNNAFHNVPHISTEGNGGLFSVNPDSVVNNTIRYQAAIGVFVGILLFLFAAGAIAFWVWECTLYPCCRKCRQNCTCKGCPKSYCKTVAKHSGDEHEPCISAFVAFTVIAVTAGLLTMAFIIWFSYETTQSMDRAIKLEDYNDASLAELKVIQNLTRCNNETINALAPDVYALNLPATVEGNFTAAVIESGVAYTSATDAVNQASASLRLRSNIQYVRDNKVYFVAVGTLIVIISLLLIMVLWLTSFVPHEPIGQCIGVTSGFQILMFVITMVAVFSPLFTLAVEMGDVCQDPNAYINEFNQKQTDGDDNDNFLSYYINCVPGSVNPTLDNLNSAYNNTLIAREAVGEVVNATITLSPTVHNASQSLYDQQTLTLANIQFAIDNSACDYPHNLMTDTETQACHGNMTSGVAYILSLSLFSFFAMLSACFVPRRTSSYTALPSAGDDVPRQLARRPPRPGS